MSEWLMKRTICSRWWDFIIFSLLCVREAPEDGSLRRTGLLAALFFTFKIFNRILQKKNLPKWATLAPSSCFRLHSSNGPNLSRHLDELKSNSSLSCSTCYPLPSLFHLQSSQAPNFVIIIPSLLKLRFQLRTYRCCFNRSFFPLSLHRFLSKPCSVACRLINKLFTNTFPSPSLFPIASPSHGESGGFLLI